MDGWEAGVESRSGQVILKEHRHNTPEIFNSGSSDYISGSPGHHCSVSMAIVEEWDGRHQPQRVVEGGSGGCIPPLLRTQCLLGSLTAG